MRLKAKHARPWRTGDSAGSEAFRAGQERRSRACGDRRQQGCKPVCILIVGALARPAHTFPKNGGRGGAGADGGDPKKNRGAVGGSPSGMVEDIITQR